MRRDEPVLTRRGDCRASLKHQSRDWAQADDPTAPAAVHLRRRRRERASIGRPIATKRTRQDEAPSSLSDLQPQDTDTHRHDRPRRFRCRSRRLPSSLNANRRRQRAAPPQRQSSARTRALAPLPRESPWRGGRGGGALSPQGPRRRRVAALAKFEAWKTPARTAPIPAETIRRSSASSLTV